jgi:hypothetical protein
MVKAKISPNGKNSPNLVTLAHAHFAILSVKGKGLALFTLYICATKPVLDIVSWLYTGMQSCQILQGKTYKKIHQKITKFTKWP